MKSLVVFSICLVLPHVFARKETAKHLIELLKVLPFEIENPVFLEYEETVRHKRIELIKAMFQTDILVQVLNAEKIQLGQYYSVFCLLQSKESVNFWLEVLSSEPLLATSKPIIMFINGTGVEGDISDIVKSFPIKLNQMAYFVNLETGRLFEVYSVNGVLINITLGTFRQQNDSALTFNFEASPEFLSFTTRRGNFHGLHLKVMTEPYYSSMYFSPGFETRAKFHSNNDTYDVTDFSSGPSFDHLVKLSTGLNFSFSLYKRKDGNWGGVENGKPTGMIKDIYEGNADLISAILTFSRPRVDFVQFLPPMFTFNEALVMGRQPLQDIEWTTFLKPFQLYLWLSLFGVAIIIAAWIQCTIRISSAKTCAISNFRADLMAFLSWLWIAFKANFGGKPSKGTSVNLSSNQTVLFTCLLMGNIVWIAYRASITSELSFLKADPPFDSLESLAKTDYK